MRPSENALNVQLLCLPSFDTTRYSLHNVTVLHACMVENVLLIEHLAYLNRGQSRWVQICMREFTVLYLVVT